MKSTANCKKLENLPFSENEILNILRIADVALADENLEKEVCNWLNVLHEPIALENLEDLHKKVNIYLQTINSKYEYKR
jgi:hypothetical protein